MHILVPFALLIAFVAAQGSSTTGSAVPHPSAIPPCVIGCAATSAASAGCNLTDIRCQCTNTAYLEAILLCMVSSCTAEQLAVAAQLAAAQCSPYIFASSSSRTSGSATAMTLTSISAATATHATTSAGATTATSSGGNALAVNSVFILLNAFLGGALAL